MTAVSARARTQRSAMRRPEAISRPDKVFWPHEGYTKRDLAEYYTRVYARLRPYVKDRMLTLERCPDGLRGECFYQREAPRGLPPGTPTKRIHDQSGSTTYVVGGRLETQLALVGLGCIAVHVWSSRVGAPRRPDWVCIDVDPPSGRFADAARAGQVVKSGLDELGLRSFPKTSGSRGLHVFVPITSGLDNGAVLAFAEAFVRQLAETRPKELTAAARISARRGRVYLDPFRNGFAQSVVAPYSVRRRPKAPISTPLDWSEVTAGLDPTRFNLGTFERRLEQSDPWESFFRRRQSLAHAVRALDRSRR